MKHRYIALLTASFLTAALVASPLAFAKDNGKNGNDDGEKNKSEKSVKVQATASTSENEHENDQGDNDQGDRGCVRAFGHLIAPGWIKHNGQVDLGSECALPSGIARLFGFGKGRGDHGTTTPPLVDTTAPVISNLTALSIRPHSATISWTTNENADSTVWFGTSSPVDTGSSPAAMRSNLVTKHVIGLTNLASSTTYHVIIRSRDHAGNVSTSTELTFTTTAGAVVSTTTLPVISNAVTTVGTSTAHLTWTTNVNADSQAYFGTTSPVVIGASSTTAVSDPALVTNHALNVTGLSTSTTYNMILQSKDSSGHTAATGQFSITTGM